MWKHEQFYVVSVIWYGFMVKKTSNFLSGIQDVADNKDFADMEALSKDVNNWTYFSAVCLCLLITTPPHAH